MAHIASPARGAADSKKYRFALRIAFAATALWTIAAPADAQVGAAVSLFSDYRFRGFSLSDDRPVAILDVSYDAPSGLYAAASGSVVTARSEGLRMLGLQVNGGYARQLRSGLTIDLGAVRSRYSSYSGLGSSRSYTELYAGVRGKVVSSRLSVSPDYFDSGASLYGEITGQFRPARNLEVQASLGALAPLGRAHDHGLATDGRIGLEWRSGRVSLHGAVTTRRGSPSFYSVGHSHRTAVVFGASFAL